MPDSRGVKPKPLIEEVEVGRRGEIVLSRRLRRALSWQEGDRLLLSVEDGRLVIERRARTFGAYLDVLGSSGARED